MFPNRIHNLLPLKMLLSEYFSLGAPPTLHSWEFLLFLNNPMFVLKPNTMCVCGGGGINLQRPGSGKNLLLCPSMASA